MQRLLVSTTRRHTPFDEPSGHLIAYNLENQKIERFCEIIEPPYREENPNPRGGLRGLKGISIYNNRIAVANASTVFIYDENWKPIRSIWHPSCAGIHDIVLLEDKVWVTGSRNDLLMSFDLEGNPLDYFDTRSFVPILNISHWQPKPFLTDTQIQKGEIDFRDPRTHDEIFCDSSHVNSIAILHNGDLLVSCGLLKSPNHLRLLSIKNWLIKKRVWQKVLDLNGFLGRKLLKKKMKNRQLGELIVQPVRGYSAVLRITNNRTVHPCLQFDNATAPAHTVRVLNNGTAIYLKTTSGELVHFDPQSGYIFSTTTIGESFLRGARELPDGNLVLGDSNKMIRFDLQKREILSINLVSDDPLEAIFDFYLLPDHFRLPPESFVSHHAKYLPVVQI